MSGFIALHRSLLDWEWYSEPNTCRVFIHCLLKANWKDKSHRGKLVKRGHFLTSLEALSQETGLSSRNIRTALKNLKATHELTVITSRQGTEIIVNNYSSYQDSESRATHDRHTDLDTQATNETESGQKSTHEATHESQSEAIENKEELDCLDDEATHDATNSRQTGDTRPTHGVTTTNKFNKGNKVIKDNYKSLDLSEISKDFDLDVVKEFIDHRINLKAKLTQPSLERNLKIALGTHSKGLGITPNQAIQETIDAGWKGVNLDWLSNRIKQNAIPQKNTASIFNLQNKTYVSGDL